MALHEPSVLLGRKKINFPFYRNQSEATIFTVQLGASNMELGRSQECVLIAPLEYSYFTNHEIKGNCIFTSSPEAN